MLTRLKRIGALAAFSMLACGCLPENQDAERNSGIDEAILLLRNGTDQARVNAAASLCKTSWSDLAYLRKARDEAEPEIRPDLERAVRAVLTRNIDRVLRLQVELEQPEAEYSIREVKNVFLEGKIERYAKGLLPMKAWIENIGPEPVWLFLQPLGHDLEACGFEATLTGKSEHYFPGRQINPFRISLEATKPDGVNRLNAYAVQLLPGSRQELLGQTEASWSQYADRPWGSPWSTPGGFSLDNMKDPQPGEYRMQFTYAYVRPDDYFLLNSYAKMFPAGIPERDRNKDPMNPSLKEILDKVLPCEIRSEPVKIRLKLKP